MRNVCETAFIRAATTTANSMQWNKKKYEKGILYNSTVHALPLLMLEERLHPGLVLHVSLPARKISSRRKQKKNIALYSMWTPACREFFRVLLAWKICSQWQWLISTYSLRYFIFILLAYSCMMVVLHFVLRPHARWQFSQFRSCFVWNYCYSYNNYKLIISP